MNTSVCTHKIGGSIKAIASKSVAHRLLICAAFANKPTKILCEETNLDIEATVACLSALGAKIEREPPYYNVVPVRLDSIIKGSVLPCNESGSTLRFLLPIVAALGANSAFAMQGRLPDRPLSPLREELLAHSVNISGKNPLRTDGTLDGADFFIDGSVSSQFVSGLLFALSLLDRECRLTVTGALESAPYVDITCDALALFGAPVRKDLNVYTVCAKGIFTSPSTVEVEGDWSNAAFFLALGALSGNVEVSGLNAESSQGDRAIIDILRAFGADITYRSLTGSYVAKASSLTGIDVNASQIPDLVPIIATVASVAKGTTRIYGASRLRLKESDRLESVYSMLNALGANISKTDDGLIINGSERLRGGTVSSFGDHRIAMSAAVAASVCEESVTVIGAEAVNKSYPSFWTDAQTLGLICKGDK